MTKLLVVTKIGALSDSDFEKLLADLRAMGYMVCGAKTGAIAEPVRDVHVHVLPERGWLRELLGF
jgi:hypothetical protein